MPKLRIAIVFISFGPYHFARAKALAETLGVSSHFIQLAASTATHPWQVPQQYLSSVRLQTISHRNYEETGYSQISRRLWRTLEEIGPDVVFTSSYRPLTMLSAARWAKSRRRRAVLFFDNTPWDRRRYWPIEAAKKMVIRQYYDAAFVGGSIHRDYLVGLGLPASRIWKPYNVVDNDRFAAGAAAVRAAAERWRRTLDLPERYFLYVGRYAPEKNLCRLLEAYRGYRAECAHPGSLVLAGEGPQRPELERLISSTGLEGVVLRPFAQIDELPAYYSLADCLVLPSTSEPWGLVINEAMACGLPIVASRLCGCVPELVRDGRNGFGFDPYQVDEITAALRAISALDRGMLRKMGEQSRAIVARYTPEIWAENIVQCAQTLVADDVR